MISPTPSVLLLRRALPRKTWRRLISSDTKFDPSQEFWNIPLPEQGQGQGQRTRESSESKIHPYKNLYPWKSKVEFGKHLVEQIVHADDGLVVVNKPFGVGVTRPKPGKFPFLQTHLRGTGTSDYSLEVALPYLREALDKPELVLVKGTERMTSGISVFADNLTIGEKFKDMLMKTKSGATTNPLYHYLVITAMSPITNDKVFRERVGVQIKASPLLDTMQPVIVRNYSKNSVKKDLVKPYLVTLNVLKYGEHKTALVGIETNSIKWNFLRIYCSDLVIPILGDHLYSSRVQTILGVPTKIDATHNAPGTMDQKLLPSLLEVLQVTQSIDVPPHMHLESYKIRNFKGKGEDLELFAPVPPHFKWTQEQLKLTGSYISL